MHLFICDVAKNQNPRAQSKYFCSFQEPDVTKNGETRGTKTKGEIERVGWVKIGIIMRENFFLLNPSYINWCPLSIVHLVQCTCPQIVWIEVQQNGFSLVYTLHSFLKLIFKLSLHQVTFLALNMSVTPGGWGRVWATQYCPGLQDGGCNVQPQVRSRLGQR